MDEIDEKLALYHNILELEDWLEIKHNPQILKEAWDTMNDYCCDLERMRHEIAYSELEDVNEQSSNEADEKRKQIEESYRELEALKESQIKEHQTMMELDSNSDFIQEVEDDMLFEKLPLFKKIQEREDFIGIEHKSEAKEVEYCRHPLIVFSPTNIGNNFITYKYISQNKADLRQAQGPP